MDFLYGITLLVMVVNDILLVLYDQDHALLGEEAQVRLNKPGINE